MKRAEMMRLHLHSLMMRRFRCVIASPRRTPPIAPDVLPDLRRSVQERKPSARLNDYVTVVSKT